MGVDCVEPGNELRTRKAHTTNRDRIVVVRSQENSQRGDWFLGVGLGVSRSRLTAVSGQRANGAGSVRTRSTSTHSLWSSFVCLGKIGRSSCAVSNCIPLFHG